MPNDRSKTYNTASLSALFSKLNGYYNLDNRALARLLLKWDLLEDNNRKDTQIVASYMKWSFTVSFLQLLNAWQWFLAGILLGRQTYMPAQIMQMYYYSIFFSYGSFLSAQFKGHYTLKVKVANDKSIKKTRKEVWVGQDNNKPCLCIKSKGRGGEHELRAKWFYEVFKNWDLSNEYPDVLAFQDNREFHVGLRNMYTYSLADIGEEFFYAGPDACPTPPSNETLLSLWRREKEWPNYFPEEFWALEHIKAAIGLHARLLENYDKESPYTTAQTLLVRSLYKYHKETGMAALLEEAMGPILAHIRIAEQ